MARRQQYIFTEETHRGRGFLIGLLIVLLLAGTFLTVVNFAMNNSVDFTSEYVTLTKMPANLDFYILHLSDLNGADVGSSQSAVKQAIGSSTVSCVVMSGNMVGESGDPQPVLDLVEVLPKGVPVLLLPGDSDPALYNSSAGSTSALADWALTLQQAGVVILNEPYPVVREKTTIWFVPENLYGLDVDANQALYQNRLDGLNAMAGALTPEDEAMKLLCEYQIARMDRIRESVSQIRQSDVQIAVTHMPLTRDYVASARKVQREKDVFSMHHVSLVLSGYYCGGQWRLPGLGAVHVPDMGFFPEDQQITGMSYLDGIYQHISPGLGASSDYPFMPFRLFNSPGATRLVLTPNRH